ncbi:hypothetical protein D3C85_1621990 [compost metagenome]
MRNRVPRSWAESIARPGERCAYPVRLIFLSRLLVLLGAETTACCGDDRAEKLASARRLLLTLTTALGRSLIFDMDKGVAGDCIDSTGIRGQRDSGG